MIMMMRRDEAISGGGQKVKMSDRAIGEPLQRVHNAHI